MKILTGQLNHISTLFGERVLPYKSYRDELLTKLMNGINRERIGTPYKPVTKTLLAILINKNPFLKGKQNDGELAALIQDCERSGNYKKFWYIVKTNNPKQ